MALTEIEKQIAEQVKSQGGSKEDFVEVLTEFRRRQQPEIIQGDITPFGEQILPPGKSIGEKITDVAEGVGEAAFGAGEAVAEAVTEGKAKEVVGRALKGGVKGVQEQFATLGEFLRPGVEQVVEQAPEVAKVVGKIGKFAAKEGGDVAKSAVAQVPETLGNLGQAGLKFNPFVQATNAIKKAITGDDQLAKDLSGIKEVSEGLKTDLQKGLGVNPDELSTAVGELTTEILVSLIPVFPKGAGQIKGVKSFANKFPTVAKIMKGAIEGAATGAKFDLVSEAEVTPETVAFGAVVGAGAEGLGLFKKALKKVKDKRVRKTIEKLAEKQDEITSKILQPGKFDDLAVEKSKEYITKSNSFKDLMNKLIKDKQKTGNLLGEQLDLVDDVFKEERLSKILDFIEEQAKSNKSLLKLPGVQEKVKTISDLTKLSKEKGLTLKQVQKVKGLIDDMFNIYKTSGEVAGSKIAAAMDSERKFVREFIEQKAPSIKNINQTYEGLRESVDLLGDLVNKSKKGESATGVVRKLGSKMPVIGEYLKKEGVTKANKLEQLLTGRTAKVEKLSDAIKKLTKKLPKEAADTNLGKFGAYVDEVLIGLGKGKPKGE